MSDSTVVVEPVATIRSTILGVKWLRSALKLLTSVAPPSILGSKMARTFVACFNGETWLGAQAGAVKMLARVEHCHAPADGLHCFPIDRLSLVAKSIDPANDLRMTWDDGKVLTLESHQRNGIRSVFNLATPLAEGIQLPEACGVDCWSVPAQDFAVAIESAKVAMGESSRHKTDGILVEASGELVSVKATDGNQLAIRKLDARDSGPNGSVFLPSETVKALLSVVKASSDYLVRFRIDADPVERVIGGKTEIVDRLRFSLRTDNVILEVMTEPVAFPDLGSVLATNLEGSADFREPARLVKAIETAHKTEEPDRDGNRIVTLASSCGALFVRTGSGETLIDNVRISGKPFERHFSTSLLLPYLKTVAKLDNLTLSVSFPEPGTGRWEPVRFSTYERGEHWVMPFGKPEPVASVEPEPEPAYVYAPEPDDIPASVKRIRCHRKGDISKGADYEWDPARQSWTQDISDPNAYRMETRDANRMYREGTVSILPDVEPEPVKAIEPEPVPTLPEMPEWVTHVRVNSCGRVTDYKRELRYPNTWTPSGNSHAYYMAMEGTDRLREYLRLGMLAIVTPEPVEPIESPEPVRTVCKAWKDVEPGARIRNPVSGEIFTVLSIGKSWCGGVRITTKERDDIVGRHDQMLDVVVEPVTPPTVTRVAACNPEPVASDVKPLRPVADTPLSGFSGPEPVKPKRVRKRKASPAASKASPEPKPTDPPVVADDVTSDTPDALVDATEANGEVPTACSSVPSHVNRVELLTTAWKSVGDTYHRSGVGCWKHDRTGSEIWAESMNHYHSANMVVFLPDPDRDFSGTDYGHGDTIDPGKAVDVGPVPASLAPKGWDAIDADTPAPGFPERELSYLAYDVVQHVKPGTFASHTPGSWRDETFATLKRAREYAERCNLYCLQPQFIRYEVICTHDEATDRFPSHEEARGEPARTPARGFPEPMPICGGSPEASTLEDLTADEIIGSTTYPDGEFDPDGSLYQAEMRTAESIIRWDLKGSLILWSEVLLGHTEEDRLWIVQQAGVSYERMTREEQRGFRDWCDWIGYQPGHITYGRLADDERYQAFVEECLVGVPVTFAEPPTSPTTGPGGSDEGSPDPLPDPRPGFPDGARSPYLTIEISGKAYGLAIGPDSITLDRGDGAEYEVTRGDRPECSCPDFRMRHAGLSTRGCKHCQALRDAGLLPPFAPSAPARGFPGPITEERSMTARELIAHLSKLDPEALVVIAKDGEGNGYSPLCEVAPIYYKADAEWSGTIRTLGDGARPGEVFAAALWPTN